MIDELIEDDGIPEALRIDHSAQKRKRLTSTAKIANSLRRPLAARQKQLQKLRQRRIGKTGTSTAEHVFLLFASVRELLRVRALLFRMGAPGFSTGFSHSSSRAEKRGG